MLACCPKLPCFKAGGYEQIKDSGAPAGISNYDVVIRNKAGKVTCTVQVEHATAGQHTITWKNTIVVQTKKGTISLPPGNCNIYGFPICNLETMPPGKVKPLEGDEYKCVCEVRAPRSPKTEGTGG